MQRKRSYAPNSPDCPHCGCNQAELINAGTRWGMAWATFECDHCGAKYSLGQRPADRTNGHAFRVPFPKLACPSCNGVHIKSRSSPAAKKKMEHVVSPVNIKDRYHECEDCGCKFSSWEEVKS